MKNKKKEEGIDPFVVCIFGILLVLPIIFFGIQIIVVPIAMIMVPALILLLIGPVKGQLDTSDDVKSDIARIRYVEETKFRNGK